MKDFIRDLCPIQETIDICTSCLATFGNGPAARIRLIRGIAPRPVPSANTMENSCVTSTFCVEVPALRRALISAALIEIFFNPKNAGNLQGSDSHAIHTKPIGAAASYPPNDNAIMNARTVAARPSSALPVETSDLLSDVIA